MYGVLGMKWSQSNGTAKVSSEQPQCGRVSGEVADAEDLKDLEALVDSA